MVYKEEADTTWDSIWQAVINAFVIVLFMALVTFIMVLLYKYHCTTVLYCFLYFATFMSIGYTGWFVFYMMVTQYYISWDLLSSILIFFNLGVISVICIFGKYAPDPLKKGFLVFISCLVCYLLSFFPDVRFGGVDSHVVDNVGASRCYGSVRYVCCPHSVWSIEAAS